MIAMTTHQGKGLRKEHTYCRCAGIQLCCLPNSSLTSYCLTLVGPVPLRAESQMNLGKPQGLGLYLSFSEQLYLSFASGQVGQI